MNILYLFQSFPKLSETFILNEIVELTKLGHDITILAKKKPATRIHRDVLKYNFLDKTFYSPVNEFMNGRDKLFAFVKKLLVDLLLKPIKTCKYLRYLLVTQKSFWSALDSFFSLEKLNEMKFDIVHCSFSTYDKIDNAYFLSKLLKCHFSLTFRAYELYRRDYHKRLLKRVNIVRRASGIITISDYNRKHLQDLFGINSSIIHSTINSESFSALNKKSKCRLISVGRFVEQKGLVYLLEACDLLNKRGVSFDCVLVGDGPEMSKYEDFIRSRNLSNVVFLGSLTSFEVRRELGSSSVFVLPCVVAGDGDRDILPNVLKEAMAMELPVVTSRICGIEELVEDGVSGLLVPPGDSVAIADAVERLLKDSKFARGLGVAGRQKVVRDFDVKKEVKKLEKIFEEVIGY